MFMDFRKRKEGGKSERKRNIDVREKHPLVAFHMCPYWGSNRQPRYVSWPGIEPWSSGVWDDTPVNWATWQGYFYFLKSLELVFLKILFVVE